MLRIPSNFTL
jgi:hypothetical protein